MSTELIVEALNLEIQKLTSVRDQLLGPSALSGLVTKGAGVRGKGRPRGVNMQASVAPAVAAAVAVAPRKRTVISPEGRERLAAAMRQRWAERRALAKKATKTAKAK